MFDQTPLMFMVCDVRDEQIIYEYFKAFVRIILLCLVFEFHFVLFLRVNSFIFVLATSSWWKKNCVNVA